MTTICVYCSATGSTVIGSDLLAACGSGVPSSGEPKWIRHNDWALGYTGELRAGNILRHHADIILKYDNPYEITEAMRRLFGEHGFDSKPDNGDSAPAYASSFILAGPGKAWDICGQLSYQPIEEGIVWARGSGSQYAMGAGTTLSNRGWGPEKSYRASAEDCQPI